MRAYLKLYTISGIIRLILNTIRTRLFYPNAKLIRFPIDFRGLKHIRWGRGLTTGRGCRIEAYPIDHKSTCIIIGENVQMNDYVHITAIKSVRIGDNVLIASKVYISDSSHGSYAGDANDSNPASIPKERQLFHKEVVVGNKVWIGEFVTILPGVTVGEGSIIGANSVVTKDVPENVIVVGNPAQIIKRFNPRSERWEKNINENK